MSREATEVDVGQWLSVWRVSPCPRGTLFQALLSACLVLLWFWGMMVQGCALGDGGVGACGMVAT